MLGRVECEGVWHSGAGFERTVVVECGRVEVECGRVVECVGV